MRPQQQVDKQTCLIQTEQWCSRPFPVMTKTDYHNTMNELYYDFRKKSPEMTSRSTDKWLWTRTHRIIQLDDEVYVSSINHFDWFKSLMMYQWRRSNSIGVNRRIWNWPSFITMATQPEVYDPILPSITNTLKNSSHKLCI